MVFNSTIVYFHLSLSNSATLVRRDKVFFKSIVWASQPLPLRNKQKHRWQLQFMENMVEVDEVSNDAAQHFLDKQHADHVLSRLYELRKREELCDVSIVVGGRAITAHRAVLAASSLYFDAMFTGKMSERTKEKVRLRLSLKR